MLTPKTKDKQTVRKMFEKSELITLNISHQPPAEETLFRPLPERAKEGVVFNCAAAFPLAWSFPALPRWDAERVSQQKWKSCEKVATKIYLRISMQHNINFVVVTNPP